MGKAKGVVLLFAGFTEDDKEETRAEITSFLEEDPLVQVRPPFLSPTSANHIVHSAPKSMHKVQYDKEYFPYILGDASHITFSLISMQKSNNSFS